MAVPSAGDLLAAITGLDLTDLTVDDRAFAGRLDDLAALWQQAADIAAEPLWETAATQLAVHYRRRAAELRGALAAAATARTRQRYLTAQITTDTEPPGSPT